MGGEVEDEGGLISVEGRGLVWEGGNVEEVGTYSGLS